MSYTNETTYYGWPLPNGSDKSTWTDDNAAKQRVDSDLHSAVEMSTAASEDIVAIKATVANLLAADIQFQSDLDTANGKIDALQDKETLQDGEIAAVRADAEDMITAYNEPTATSTHAYTAGDYFIYNDVLYRATSSIAIGDTIVPDSNCATTNVASELSQITSVLSNKQKTITTETFTGTTDAYGNVNVPTTIVKPSTGVLYGANVPNAFVAIDMNTTYDTFILRVRNNDETMTNLANEQITIQIEYCLSN